MGATTLLSLFSTISNGEFKTPKRVGCFSYGSGCCSEFFSGLVSNEGQKFVQSLNFEEHLNQRYKLNMDEYHQLLLGSNAVKFGTRNVKLDWNFLANAKKDQSGIKRLYLKEIKEFHRKYEWV
jgi:polyketide biosynthesis 3-hydroxy-3-methylglutaryl-CoA synthase-like enzyme PksG